MYLPVMFNLINKKILIIGGGSVGLRKAKKILDYGGVVSVVSLDFKEEFKLLQNVELIQAAYERRQLVGVHLVIAATKNQALNLQIYKDCNQDKVICNVVDQATLSDVIFPASIQKDDLSFAVSSGGNSPLMAKEILSSVLKLYDQQLAVRVVLIGEIRRHIIETEKDDIKKQQRLEAIMLLTTKDLEDYRNEIRREH